MSGHYEYLVMPFGLANALSVFPAFVNEVFRDMIGYQGVVYIDEILVCSATLEHHITSVRVVLERLLSVGDRGSLRHPHRPSAPGVHTASEEAESVPSKVGPVLYKI